MNGSEGFSLILLTSVTKSSDLISRSVSAPDDSEVEGASLSTVVEDAVSCASVGKFLWKSSTFLLKPGGKTLLGVKVEATDLLFGGEGVIGMWKEGLGGTIKGGRGGKGLGRLIGKMGGGGAGTNSVIRWKLVCASIKMTQLISLSILGVV